MWTQVRRCMVYRSDNSKRLSFWWDGITLTGFNGDPPRLALAKLFAVDSLLWIGFSCSTLKRWDCNCKAYTRTHTHAIQIKENRREIFYVEKQQEIAYCSYYIPTVRKKNYGGNIVRILEKPRRKIESAKEENIYVRRPSSNRSK